MPDAKQTPAAQAGPQVEDEGMSRNTLIALWSFVGVFGVGCVLFLVWHSHSTHQRKIAAANDRISEAVTAANEWMRSVSGDDGQAIEQQLRRALGRDLATDKANGETLLKQVRERREQLAEQARIEQAQRRATAIFNDAKREIDAKRVTEAITLLREYVDDPHATEKGEARRVLAEAKVAASDTFTLDALVLMNDAEFDRARTSGTIDDGRVTHPVLLAVRGETVQRNIEEASQRREAVKLAEKKRREAERLAALERKRQEEEQQRAEEARRKAEQERRKAKAKPDARGDPNVWHVKSEVESVFVAVSEEVHDRFMQLAGANDRHGVAQLAVAGQVFMIPGGTKVRVIQDKGWLPALFEVRVLEGEHAGRSGWVLGEKLEWEWGR